MHTNIRFKGVIPPMITPFSSDGAVDYPALERNIAQWNQAGLGGYLVLGSNSEAASLSETEKLELVARSAAAMQPQHVLLAGTGMESTVETIRLSNLAAREGAQAALVLTPFYYKDSLSDEAQIRHFQEVADNVHIPVLIYNVPKYTNINVSNRVIEVLSRHPNIIGMKDSSGNIAQLVEFQRVADPRFQILTGTAGVWYPALVLGVQAGIMALANCAPAELVEVQSLFETGHPAEAEALYRKWVPVNHAVTATYGVAGLKHACTLRGYAAGAVRSPLPPLSDKGKEAIAHLLAGC
ncbi:MAG: 4-hydroxy-tetrahydrodipicolinate synthase [Bacteroidota bacterium]|jgi:4-hydroxy-2-oxoglutarate aldolase